MANNRDVTFIVCKVPIYYNGVERTIADSIEVHIRTERAAKFLIEALGDEHIADDFHGRPNPSCKTDPPHKSNVISLDDFARIADDLIESPLIFGI